MASRQRLSLRVLLLALLAAGSWSAQLSGQTASKPKPAPAAADAADWLAICSKCPAPTVTSKSGIGTAKAVAEARMKRADLIGPDGVCATNDNACIMSELKKVYRATADCTAGRITPIDEKTYTLAGLWDGEDAGRTKWKDAEGQVVGRDNASGGLGISQQWEVLCPGPVSPALLAKVSGASDANVFAASITDFRPSLVGRTRILSATVRFQNKTNRQLILGYVRGTGLAIDEQGNRYTINTAGNVRGIGEITGSNFDSKFTLPAGQSGDARFEFAWEWDGRAIIGTRSWDVELTVREVNEVAPGQYRLGTEHVLQFKQAAPASQMTAAPAPGGMPVTTATAAPSAPAGSAPAATPPQELDACGGKPRCYDAGPFVAELEQVTASQARTARLWHIVSMNVRVRNKTNQPLTLGYVVGTGVLIDDLGNRYAPSAPPADVKGMGRVQARSADPQFVLGPGQARVVTFGQSRAMYGNTMVIGSKFGFEISLAQLEVIYNGQQVRTVREYALTFPDFALGGGPTAAPTTESITDAAKKLRGIFQKKPPQR